MDLPPDAGEQVRGQAWVLRNMADACAYLPDGDRYVVFASKAGAPSHPSWYHNLKAHPEVEAEVGGETMRLHASEAEGEERDRLFSTQAQRSPAFAEYQEKAGKRLIPVMVLARR